MWVFPRTKGTPPRYEQKEFPESVRRGNLRLVASPDGREGSLTIGQDVLLYAGLVDGDESASVEIPDGRQAFLHVARGTVSLNGRSLAEGDGAAIESEKLVELTAGDGAEVVLWDLPRA